MLRSARVPPMGSLVDRIQMPLVGPTRELLLAMAPLPRGVAYKVEGWPGWLLPSELAVARSMAAVRDRRPAPEDPPPP